MSLCFPSYALRIVDLPLHKVKLYLNGLGGEWPVAFWSQYIGQQGLEQFFSVLEVWWLGFWAQQYILQDSSSVYVP